MHEGRLAELEHYETSPNFSEREKVALRYADAITWDPSSADDAMWADLYAHFTEAELVELGFFIGLCAGAQRWILTVDVRHAEVEAESTTGYRPELAKAAEPRPAKGRR